MCTLMHHPTRNVACLLSAACVHTGAAVLCALAHGPGPLEQTHGNRCGRDGQVRARMAGTRKCKVLPTCAVPTVGSAGVKLGCKSVLRSFWVLFDGAL